MSMEVLNTKFPMISEKILLELKAKELKYLSRTCQTWHEIISQPNFWIRKCYKVGMSATSVKQWISILNKATEEGDIKNILRLLRMNIEKAEEGRYESVVFSVLCQERICDIKFMLQFLNESFFESMKEEFRIISTFEDFVWPVPMHSGIEIEVCLTFIYYNDRLQN